MSPGPNSTPLEVPLSCTYTTLHVLLIHIRMRLKIKRISSTMHSHQELSIGENRFCVKLKNRNHL